jgi:hypothetical protein
MSESLDKSSCQIMTLVLLAGSRPVGAKSVLCVITYHIIPYRRDIIRAELQSTVRSDNTGT